MAFVPTNYPNDRRLKKALKISHEGLEAAHFKPVLEWLETRWSRDEAAISRDLQAGGRSFEGWLLALAQAFGDVMGPNASAPMNMNAVLQTGLSSLAELLATRVCNTQTVHLQLIVAWLWAGGQTVASKRGLLYAQKLTGYTDTALKNILEEAQPTFEALRKFTKRRDLWRIRDACRLVLVYAPQNETMAMTIADALRSHDEALPLVCLSGHDGDKLVSIVDSSSIGDVFVLLWSHDTAVIWSNPVWATEIRESLERNRVFLLLGSLDAESGPEGLLIRETVPFCPDHAQGVDMVLRIWLADRTAEQDANRAIAPARYPLRHELEGATLYVAFAHGDVYIPVTLCLEHPAGVLVTRLIKELKLPVTFEILGRPTHHIRYQFFHEDRRLTLEESLANQGVRPGSLLHLEFRCEAIHPETINHTMANFRSGAHGENAQVRLFVESALSAAGFTFDADDLARQQGRFRQP